MKHYLVLTVAMAAVLLGLFALAEALEIPLLTDPEPWLQGGGPVTAVVGVGLLVVDVFLPVPSSLVMVAHGAAFGVVAGAALSVLGTLGAAWLGFLVGRRGGPLLERWIPAEERRRADRMLARWGGAAVVLSRPVPILAETVAILAGASTLGWLELTLAALLGALPAAVLLAMSGAAAAHFLGSFGLVFGVVLALALVWLLVQTVKGRGRGRRGGDGAPTAQRAAGLEAEAGSGAKAGAGR